MGKRKSGVIKRILEEHFDGFWKLHIDKITALRS